MLEYSLHDNVLTDRPDDMSALAHPGESYDREAFINLMLQRGTLLTKTDIIAVFTNMEETAANIIENGGTLNLPLFSTGFSVTGVFEGATDTFDPSRHRVNVNVRKGIALREAEKRVKVTKIKAPSTQPQILEVKDSISGTVDKILTSGGAVEVAGVNIKLSGNKNEVGLYFVAEDGTETPSSTIIMNKPSQLIALIPQLAAGLYKIKVVTQFSGGRELKDSKEVLYPKSLPLHNGLF
jgi:hypothetical protein